jgi:hypothetical protein
MQQTALQKQSLYNIRIDHLALMQEIQYNDGELTPELEEALQLNEQEFEDKALSYGFVIKTFDDQLEIIDKEFARLDKIREKIDKTKSKVKEVLSEAMQQFGFDKIETPLLKLSFRKSEAVEITNGELIPAEFIKVKTVESIDKIGIKAALKEGAQVY